MKKIFFAVCFLLSLSIFSNAQQQPGKKIQKKETAASVSSTAASTALNKDGTPDKRYKANKATAASAAGPLKKDGTPDKRYKANKKTR